MNIFVTTCPAQLGKEMASIRLSHGHVARSVCQACCCTDGPALGVDGLVCVCLSFYALPHIYLKLHIVIFQRRPLVVLLLSLFKWYRDLPWPGGSVGGSIVPYTKRWQVWFPVRAHTQISGSIPSRGKYRRKPINVSLSYQCFSLSTFLSLQINGNISSGEG